jgi:hypothetical protein
VLPGPGGQRNRASASRIAYTRLDAATEQPGKTLQFSRRIVAKETKKDYMVNRRITKTINDVMQIEAATARDALKNAIGPTILGSNGVVFRIVLELMPPSQCDIRLLA